MPKGTKLGPRVTVQFAAAKKTSKKTGTQGGSARYVFMLKSTAEALGLKAVPQAGVKNKKGTTIAVRGSKGAGSIKVPIGNSKDGKQKYKSIPVPAGATINEIRQFLSKASNKPQSFVSVDGRTYPIVTSK
ncbi:hypothetical protein [Nostoc sp. CHAB 5715]|uniref:hypothetical protein n=1 Tax=Nostoc sp. CHAB 5715 TaxID=2780400 RepID=UPI001E62ECA2|nr:hypothetical protein [Nostoc sp. CHAB 5715]MCC5624451.1 hypothetical protein [Nostoc sp. CHAB 5715]